MGTLGSQDQQHLSWRALQLLGLSHQETMGSGCLDAYAESALPQVIQHSTITKQSFYLHHTFD